MDRAILDADGWTDLHPVAVHEREWEVELGECPAPRERMLAGNRPQRGAGSSTRHQSLTA
jgi:hypothetical protein